MNKKELKSGRKLLAEILGYRYNGEWVEYLAKNGRWINNYHITGDYDYRTWEPDSDWNQLMLAWENISKLEPKKFSIEVLLCREMCWIKVVDIQYEKLKLSSLNVVGEDECKTLIEATFKSLVEFIKWYNKQSHD